MTVVANDLTQPLGELEKELFPGDTVESFNDRLAGYLDDAEAKVELYEIADDVDAATIAWVYYRAYRAVGQRLLAQERTATIDGQGSNRFEQAQADGFFALAEQWKAAFDAVIPVENAAAPAVKSSWFRAGFEW